MAIRAVSPLAVLGLAAAAVAYVAIQDPNQAGNYPTCPFFALTGYQCAGCGSLRAIHALVHGDLGAAVELNLITVAMIPALAFSWLRWTIRRWTGKPRSRFVVPWLIWTFIGVVLAFWLLRNVVG